MALWLDLVPIEDKNIVLNNLIHDIMVTNKIHITTGILGNDIENNYIQFFQDSNMK